MKSTIHMQLGHPILIAIYSLALLSIGAGIGDRRTMGQFSARCDMDGRAWRRTDGSPRHAHLLHHLSRLDSVGFTRKP